MKSPSKMTVPELLSVLIEHKPVIDKPQSQELSRYLGSVAALMSHRMIQIHSVADMGQEFAHSLQDWIDGAAAIADRAYAAHLANIN